MRTSAWTPPEFGVEMLMMLLHRFYILPLPLIAAAFVIVTFGFVRLRRRSGDRRWFRWGCCVMLGLWLLAAMQLTIFDRSGTTDVAVKLIPFQYIWEAAVTGNRELYRSAFMNVALFFPAGLLTASLLPEHFPRRRKLLTAVGLFGGLSLCIELSQLVFRLGRAETDDLIHNTLGAFLGILPILLADGHTRPKEDTA